MSLVFSMATNVIVSSLVWSVGTLGSLGTLDRLLHSVHTPTHLPDYMMCTAQL